MDDGKGDRMVEVAFCPRKPFAFPKSTATQLNIFEFSLKAIGDFVVVIDSFNEQNLQL